MLAGRLKSLNPNITLVFYYNANLCLPGYRLYNLTAQHAPYWWLRNSSNNPFIAPIDSGAGARPPFPYNAHGGGVPVYDFTVPDVRTAWVQECLDMTSPTGGFDGCMADRWVRTPFKHHLPPGYTPEEVKRWTAARDKATAELSSKAKEHGVYLVGVGAPSSQVDAVSNPGYGAHGEKSLLEQMQIAGAGTGLLASYKPRSVGNSFETQLAKFLIGAARGHYFGAGSWTCNHTSREGVTWHPEYSRPLGHPLGNATQTGTLWSRRFGSCLRVMRTIVGSLSIYGFYFYIFS